MSNAQLLPTFKLGVKGALGFSSLSSEGRFFNSDTKTGFQLGAWGRVGIAGFHVQPEAYYASKKVGAQFEQSGEKGEATFQSFDVPILLGTRIGLGPIGVRVQAGPVFSFAQDGKVNFTTATDWDRYKKTSTGIVGGIGADISKFTVDLRYEHGLTDLNESPDYNQKIRMWTIGVGFAFL
ncbi:hypothetical protein GCM10017764_22000 [Sphingobacterium griseoflavum]|uniref:Outer membrane protein beta-barrel domain-containing protein n=2 Tax=Sphingobacterium griseoflavum TaxID=1474952 RepID=A0ABQ3HZC4_9SPHI|nr:hypothetical protein GCM10017764_22000 [Sphingobacterium griseoflavum]